MSLLPPATSAFLSYIVIPSDESKSIQCLRMDGHEMVETVVAELLGPSVKLSLLLRPCYTTAGLYAYSSATAKIPNIRATRLSMGCGLLSLRFQGNVLLLRSTVTNTNLMLHEIRGATMISHDLRSKIQLELESLNHDIIPDWLGNASQQNYHDSVVVAHFAAAMSSTTTIHSDKDNVDDDDNENNCSDSSEPETTVNKDILATATGIQHVAARTSLCLHCRGPADTLCRGCNGAYFCSPPRTCQQYGWSHDCVCRTWNRYSARRKELSTFPFDKWHQQLLGRDCQISDQPYRTFLQNKIGFANDSWWRTEMDGWAGGDSASASTVDIHTRRSYQHGFAPVTEFPPERRLTNVERSKSNLGCNACGILKVPSWKEYYELRGIPFSSPTALLLTFPLTIYHSIVEYGEVPITVASMLKRPMRIHVVGIEKELNFIDLFKEIGFLLPEDTQLEMVFIVRNDMLPPRCRGDSSIKVHLTTNLLLIVTSGTYGDDLHPNFDCGSGPPDMIIGLNAGLFAYESWRSVVTFLYHNKGVVGVFTDYNEHSGMHCASLGGSQARNSLGVNPFRQPLAMPVYSMNLPQFSNGFTYVYNQQELDP